MRSCPRPVTLALACVLGFGLAFGLTGCAPDSPAVVPTEVPVTPIFVSDEEALAAAEEAYAAYLRVTDQLGGDPTTQLTDLDDYVTADYARLPKENIEALRASDLTISGQSAFDSAVLQQISSIDESSAAITIYVCLDVAQVRVIDAQGMDVTPSARQNRLRLEVEMVAHRGPPISLRISRSEQWTGGDEC